MKKVENFWLNNFLKRKGKSTIEELTIEEIEVEIADVKDTMNIVNLEKYLDLLYKIIAERKKM